MQPLNSIGIDWHESSVDQAAPFILISQISDLGPIANIGGGEMSIGDGICSGGREVGRVGSARKEVRWYRGPLWERRYK